MTQGEHNTIDTLKAGLDIVSLSALGGWFIGALPVIATGLTVIWTAIRIYETETVQRWLGRVNPPVDRQ